MNDTSDPTLLKIARLAEWLLVIFGAMVCIGVAAIFGSQQSQDLWPVPGLYFIEFIILALAGAASLLTKTDISPFLASIPWIIGGILLTFVILGGFSIGPFLFPAMLAYFIDGIISDWRSKRRMNGHLGIAVIAALIQGSIIVMINLLLTQRLS